MIFAPHIIIGAAIGAKTHNLGLIVILGILSHIIMDKLPHWEYSVIPNIKKFRETKSIKFLLPVILKSIIDVIIGLSIVFVLVWQKNLLDFYNLKFILAGIFFSLLLDIILTAVLIWGSQRLKETYFSIHNKYLHRAKQEDEKEGKITFLGLFTQILVVIFSLFIFFF